MFLQAAQSRSKALTDAPLVSRTKLIERQQEEFRVKHPITRIRFRLPDQYQIETTFSSNETVDNLFKFLNECFQMERKISLSIGPPPRPIKPSPEKTLFDIDLVPGAIINVSFDEPTNSNVILKPSLLSQACNIKVREANPSIETSAASTSSSTSAPNPTSAATTSTGTAKTTKKPSWLRLGH